MGHLTGDLPEGQHVVDALTAAGWTVLGQRAGVYVRLGWPGDTSRSRSLTVPLDPEMADYGDLMGGVFDVLEAAMFAGRAAHQALHRIDPEVYR